MKHVKINNVTIGNDLPFTLIAGPCAMESRDHAMMMADQLVEITSRNNIPFIFKASFDKANRTSINSPRGIGIYRAMGVFDEIKKTFGCPVLTDVHENQQCSLVSKHVDVLQIPAFLCRQTDLLVAAGDTGRTVNIKKGQFVSPEDMVNVVKKVESTGNEKILLTERGTFFGYGNLVVDFRSLSIMAEMEYPVVMDSTHSVQKPGGLGNVSGGDRKYVPLMAKAAVVNGVGAVFMETHNDPDNALSDGPNSMPLNELEDLLKLLTDIDGIVK